MAANLLCTTSLSIDGLALSGTKIAVATSSLTGRLWNGEVVVIEDKQIVQHIATEAGNCDITWAGAKDEFLLSAGDDGSVIFYLATSPKPKKVFAEHDDIVSCLSVSEKETFVSGSWDSRLKVWNLSSDNSSTTLEGHSGPVYSVDWSPQAKDVIISSSQDKTVRIWDKRQQSSTLSLPCTSIVRSVHCNPHDEFTFATGDDDGTISIADLRKLERVATFKGVHQDSIRRVRYSPHTHRLLASASDDTIAAVIDTDGKKIYNAVGQHSDFVRALAWDAGHQGALLTGGWDKRIVRHEGIGTAGASSS